MSGERPRLDVTQVDLEAPAMAEQLRAVAIFLETGEGRAAAEAAVEQLRVAIARRPALHVARMEIFAGLAPGET